MLEISAYIEKPITYVFNRGWRTRLADGGRCLKSSHVSFRTELSGICFERNNKTNRLFNTRRRSWYRRHLASDLGLIGPWNPFQFHIGWGHPSQSTYLRGNAQNRTRSFLEKGKQKEINDVKIPVPLSLRRLWGFAESGRNQRLEVDFLWSLMNMTYTSRGPGLMVQFPLTLWWRASSLTFGVA